MVIKTLPFTVKNGEAARYVAGSRLIRSHGLNVGTGSGGYEERQENDSHSVSAEKHTQTSSKMLVVLASAYYKVQITVGVI